MLRGKERMVLSNTKSQENKIIDIKQNKQPKNKKKNLDIGYVGYNQDEKPLALILDIDPPTLEPKRILETIPEVKQISQIKIEFSLHE